MNLGTSAKKFSLPGRVLICLFILACGIRAQAQAVYTVDQFDPTGVGGNNYSAGHIGSVWGNWFGNAFQSLVWDGASDASNNSGSGSMKITANFNGQGQTPNQYEVYDGFSGISPALNGLQFTNFQCDVRFAAGSATTNGTFGHLQFGIAVGNAQDYFGSVDVPSSNTNWVHVNINLNAVADTSLQSINDVLIHIYGPGMSGTSTLWVDNIEFTGASPVTTNCVVDWNDVHQHIDGFGAASSWNSMWSTAQADIFFSTNNSIVYTDNLGTRTTNNGIGLSLLRTRIAPGGTTIENSIMQLARDRGAKVWSAPWSPAAQFKDNGNTTNGGFLGTPANYQAYANQQAAYVANMQSLYNVNLYAISIQNEPDAVVNSYESCNWTPQQIHDFVPYLYNALVAANVSSTKIMLPESENWQDPSNLTVTAMSDPSVAADVGIVADHNYDGASGPPTLTKNTYGKALWETEVSLLSGSDSSIANGVYYAQRIHLFMTVAEVNAWHYWWLISGSVGNEGLMDNNSAITKRLFTVGNFSRFVRPGYYRIGVSNNALTSVSAYKDPVAGGFAVVAVNSSSATTQIFNLTNFPGVATVTPWITSATLSLASQPPVAVSNSTFTYNLPALSVVTFVGVASNSPPTLTSVPDQTINAGATLVTTNSAYDPGVPPQSLTFSLVGAPANASLSTNNGTNAVFTWRPLVSQANTTNTVTIKVTDNGSPPLSASQSFTITVNPLGQPTVSSIAASAGEISLVVDGPTGPDYSLLASTNLIDWQTIFTTNSPTLPITLVDTNFNTYPVRYYRVQIGP